MRSSTVGGTVHRRCLRWELRNVIECAGIHDNRRRDAAPSPPSWKPPPRVQIEYPVVKRKEQQQRYIEKSDVSQRKQKQQQLTPGGRSGSGRGRAQRGRGHDQQVSNIPSSLQPGEHQQQQRRQQQQAGLHGEVGHLADAAALVQEWHQLLDTAGVDAGESAHTQRSTRSTRDLYTQRMSQGQAHGRPMHAWQQQLWQPQQETCKPRKETGNTGTTATGTAQQRHQHGSGQAAVGVPEKAEGQGVDEEGGGKLLRRLQAEHRRWQQLKSLQAEHHLELRRDFLRKRVTELLLQQAADPMVDSANLGAAMLAGALVPPVQLGSEPCTSAEDIREALQEAGMVAGQELVDSISYLVRSMLVLPGKDALGMWLLLAEGMGTKYGLPLLSALPAVPQLLMRSVAELEASLLCFAHLLSMTPNQAARVACRHPEVLLKPPLELQYDWEELLDVLGPNHARLAALVACTPRLLSLAPSLVHTKWERVKGLAGRYIEWERELLTLMPCKVGILLTASHEQLDVLEWFAYMGLSRQVSMVQAVTYDPELFMLDFGEQYTEYCHERHLLGHVLPEAAQGRRGNSWEADVIEQREKVSSTVAGHIMGKLLDWLPQVEEQLEQVSEHEGPQTHGDMDSLVDSMELPGSQPAAILRCLFAEEVQKWRIGKDVITGSTGGAVKRTGKYGHTRRSARGKQAMGRGPGAVREELRGWAWND